MAVAFHSESIEIQEEDEYDDIANETPEDDVKYENVGTKTSAQQKHPQKKSGKRLYRPYIICVCEAADWFIKHVNVTMALSH